ncbi:MAG: hydrogenase maturation protease [Bacteroidetes bacterium]|nr:hydrogenase maturation protease [Bacteroidota bacterium]
MHQDYNILIYGYGNPGRQDDGLGNAMIEKLESWVKSQKMKGIHFDSNYQLNIEDAAEIAKRDLVIFVDASTEDIDDFILTQVNASTDVAFTSHAASPGYIVGLCKDIYKTIPPTWLLHIRGYEWEFKEGLSTKAKQNLEDAYELMKEKLENPQELIDAFEPF